jgi:hypothetical protein
MKNAIKKIIDYHNKLVDRLKEVKSSVYFAEEWYLKDSIFIDLDYINEDCKKEIIGILKKYKYFDDVSKRQDQIISSFKEVANIYHEICMHDKIYSTEKFDYEHSGDLPKSFYTYFSEFQSKLNDKIKNIQNSVYDLQHDTDQLIGDVKNITFIDD